MENRQTTNMFFAFVRPMENSPEIAKQKLLEMKAINYDEKFIITGGVPVNIPGTTNYISIL